MSSEKLNLEILPPQKYIKRVPLTCGLLLVSLLGFTASLDFNNASGDFLSRNISGDGSNGNALAFMFGGCVMYLVVGLIAIFAIILIWRGIADWPLNQN